MKLYAVGGYSEVGKNMTCIEVKEDAVCFDCGLFLPPIVELEDHMARRYNEELLRQLRAVPNDHVIKKIKNKVRAFLITHAHLDHLGALPYLVQNYKAEIVATPFTVEVLKSLAKDANVRLEKVKAITPNSSFFVGKRKYFAEFINITHSTLQTVLIALHTPKGIVLYANDFKFDNSPILGKRPNYKRLKQIAAEGVHALIVDSLYASREQKTPSEKIARGLLEDVLLTTENENAAVCVTTFSSHLARLKSIVDCGKQLGRKILFLGRSLNRYVSAAAKLKLVPFMPDIKLFGYKAQIRAALKAVAKSRTKYLIVCTGHQGEPGSVLDRISREELPFKFQPKDHCIFSSSMIPTPTNIANRTQLEKRLKKVGVRIFDSVHASGHCSREDLRDLIEIVQPEHIIPAHGDVSKLTALVELASELGYRLGKDVHLLQDGQVLEL